MDNGGVGVHRLLDRRAERIESIGCRQGAVTAKGAAQGVGHRLALVDQYRHFVYLNVQNYLINTIFIDERQLRCVLLFCFFGKGGARI